MSDSAKGRGFSPTRFTIEDFQSLGNVFKELLAENPAIKAAIIVAGIGGLLESLHIVWLVFRYVFRF